MKQKGSLLLRYPRLLTAFAALVAFAGMAQGDSVLLQNGDRLSGTLEQLGDDKLVFSTAYAGEIHIDASEVVSIGTDDPVAVKMKDGEILVGRLSTENESQILFTGEAGQPLVLGQVDAIARDEAAFDAPPPEKTPEKSAKKWTGTLDSGATWRSGDTDTLDANLGLGLTRKIPKHTLSFTLSGGYGEVDSQVNTRRIAGTAKYQYYPRERLYILGHTGLEHDPGARLDLRFELGAGVGADVIKKERVSLSLDAGLDYSREYWNKYSIRELEDKDEAARDSARDSFWNYVKPSDASFLPLLTWTAEEWLTGVRLGVEALEAGVEQETEREDKISLRLTGRYEQKLLERCKLSEELVLLPELPDISEFRLKSNLAFDTALSEKLSLRLSLKTDYDSDIGDGEDQLNNTFITALRYAF